MTALAILMLVTHLGLLFWELRYVSASLAFPGLKPTADKEAVASMILGLEFPPISPRRRVARPVGSGPSASTRSSS